MLPPAIIKPSTGALEACSSSFMWPSFYGAALLGKKPADIPGNIFVYMTSENQFKPVPLWIFGKCQLQEIKQSEKE